MLLSSMSTMVNVAAGCQKDPPAVWTSVLAALANIQHQQQCLAESLQHQQSMLSASQQAFASQQQQLSSAQERMIQRIVQLEKRAQNDCQGDHHVEVSRRWPCPLCNKPLKHAPSFKGHIRRLVNKSTRPKCHLNPRDGLHQSLVQRFEGSDFYTKATNFCIAFYAFVARAISKTRDPEISRRLVNAWLEAASASDGRSFPTCSYSSGPDSDQGAVGISSDSFWSSGSGV